MARRRCFRLDIPLVAAVALGGAGNEARGHDLTLTPRYVPDQVIVRVEQARYEELKFLEHMVGAVGHKRLFEQDLWLFTLPSGSDVRATAMILESLPFVTYATANAVVHSTLIPDDPKFGSQWAYYQPDDVDIDGTEGWDLQTDASGIVVAVIDTGTQLDHPDLAANLWTNPGEIPGNGIDDEGNGYVDDMHGCDVCNSDGDPYDDLGHGTYTAGILGAVGNNGVGVAGVCWKVQIMPLKFICGNGSATIDGAVQAIEYAMNNGAHLSSNSWGCYCSEAEIAPVADALHAAWVNKGMLFVAGAGNDGTDNDVTPFFPASIPYPEVFAVMSSSQQDDWASNYGHVSVDLAAPGTNIYSTWLGSTYRFATGSSAACPFVAGAVALCAAHCPGTDLLSIKTQIMAAVDKPPAFLGKVASDGRLNLRTALESCPCLVRFEQFGSGLAGSGGFVPTLSGTDGGCAGGGHELHVANVLGGATGVLWFGLAQGDIPFLGGHFYIDLGSAWSLVTLALQGQPGLPGAGFLDLPGVDMNLYSGLTIYLQGLFLDAGALFGVSLSNGIKMIIA